MTTDLTNEDAERRGPATTDARPLFRRIAIGFAVAVVLAAIAGVAWHFTHRQGPGTAAASGTVASVNPAKGTFTVVTSNHGTVTIDTGKDTQFEQCPSQAGCSTGTFSELKHSQHVAVYGSTSSADVKATRVSILAS